jgi:glycosyltransferase involved in cell wall biosynthesis
MITIAITHCNRLKYLRALVSSLKGFIEKFDPQLLLVDNGSVEKGTSEFLSSLAGSWDVRTINPSSRNWINDEYIAKNWIIERAKHDVILFLQDDAELVVPEDHLKSLVDAFVKLPHFSMEIEGVRRVTTQRRTGGLISDAPGVFAKSDPHFPTHGLFKAQVLRENGPYRVDWPLDRAYWGRSEDEYDTRLKSRHDRRLLSCLAKVPCFISVWNDPRGGYAFIRGDKRWGHYRDPQGSRYYEPVTLDKVAHLESQDPPAAFLDLAQPIGWTIARDQSGEIFKYPQSNVLVEGPSAFLESSDDT